MPDGNINLKGFGVEVGGQLRGIRERTLLTIVGAICVSAVIIAAIVVTGNLLATPCSC